MAVELTVPEVGESISEVVIGEWLKAEGDQVQVDESVAELESEKATVELPAPVSGKLVKLLKAKGETAGIGEVIAVIEETQAGATKPAPASPAPAARPEPAAALIEPKPDSTSERQPVAQATAEVPKP